jgi:hypothetical protein
MNISRALSQKNIVKVCVPLAACPPVLQTGKDTGGQTASVTLFRKANLFVSGSCRTVVMLLLFVLYLSACGDDDKFDDTRLIEKTRILAIKAESPEIDPGKYSNNTFKIMGFPVSTTELAELGIVGAQTKLTALAADPSHRALTYGWLDASPFPGQAVQESYIADFFGASIFLAGRETIMLIPGEENEPWPEREIRQANMFTLNADGEIKYGAKAIYLFSEDVKNHNPVVEQIAIEGNDLFFSAGDVIKPECHMTDPDPEDVDDRLLIDWYIESGEFTDFDDFIVTWKLSGGLSGRVTIYCIGNDDRGGIDWRRQDIWVGTIDMPNGPEEWAGSAGNFLVESEDGYIFHLGTDIAAISNALQENRTGDNDWITVGGTVIPDEERRYNFYLTPDSVTVATSMPVATTTSIFDLENAETIEIADNVANLEDVSSMALRIGSGDIDILYPTQYGEIDPQRLNESLDFTKQLLDHSLRAVHYIKLRVLKEL